VPVSLRVFNSWSFAERFARGGHEAAAARQRLGEHTPGGGVRRPHAAQVLARVGRMPAKKRDRPDIHALLST